jgi:hypothetical protein
MSATTQANDWEVAGICGVGVAVSAGAGAWLFKFRSQQAGMNDFVAFSGIGLGIGVPAGFADSFWNPQYTRINSWYFSLNDLDLSEGFVEMPALTIINGYNLLNISAMSGKGRWKFHSEPVQGFMGTNLWLNGIKTCGRWKVL